MFKQGQKGPKGAEWGQMDRMESNRARWGQTGEIITIGAKQDQMGQSGAKGGQKETKRVENGQWGSNLSKFCKI